MPRYLITLLLIIITLPTWSSAWSSSRPAAVAGTWYASDTNALTQQVSTLLSQAPNHPFPSPPRALILPHAGYTFSGPTAATGIKTLQNLPIKRIILLGPAHYTSFVGLALPNHTHFTTPLGDVPLDTKTINQLTNNPLFNTIPQAHTREHALESQLPLLQHTLQPGWTLIPILMGQMHPKMYSMAATALRPLLDETTILIISGDFTHHGPNYHYEHFPKDNNLSENIKKLDMDAWRLIAERKPEELLTYQKNTGITACALGPATLLAHLLPESTQAHLLHYTTSGAITGNNDNTVSYLAALFTNPQPLAGTNASTPLTEPEMTLLHQLAQHAVRQAVTQGHATLDEATNTLTLPATLNRHNGVFITLKKNATLRGCIGHIQGIHPLPQGVVENAVNAALKDPRFRPVTSEELNELSLEVSVLSPLIPVSGPEAIEVGRHGIVMTKNGHRAVFLPEVATEQGWNLKETLRHLSMKAGLPEDAWQQGASFEVFTSQTHHAPMVR